MNSRLAYLLFALDLFFILNSRLSTAFAQSTAFTYQGRLTHGTNLANGSYDLRFTVYDSADTSGKGIAGPLTNSSTPVNSGLFSVVLDFGAGVFSGPGRWLQIDVRTNGDSAFTALMPRQPVLPAPYALMASSASNLLGTLPAAQLSGTIPLAQLPGVVLTNATTAVTLSGNFSGSGAGLTNLNGAAISGVGTTNLCFSTALSLVCAKIADYGVNRGAWPNTKTRLANGGQLSVLLVGMGWTEDSIYSHFLTNLANYVPFAGFSGSTMTFLDASTYSLAYLFDNSSGMDSGLHMNGDDTNWHRAYFVLTNAGNIVTPIPSYPGMDRAGNFDTRFPGDVMSVGYLANPGGGDFLFEIRTNFIGTYDNPTIVDSNWTAVATIKANSSSWQGRVFTYTNSAPIRARLRVRALSGAWTPIVSWGLYNSRTKPGFKLAEYGHQGSTMGGILLANTNKWVPILKAFNPTTVIGDYEQDNQYFATMTNAVGLLNTYFPSCDRIFTSPHLGAGAPAVLNPGLMHQWLYSNGLPGLNLVAALTDVFATYANGVALGFYDSPGDSHLSCLGYWAMGQLESSWLNFWGTKSESPVLAGGALALPALTVAPVSSAYAPNSFVLWNSNGVGLYCYQNTSSGWGAKHLLLSNAPPPASSSTAVTK